MITILPVPRALVPIDSDAARRISAPNYDEFQGDLEIWESLRDAPECVLAVTMAHCAVTEPGAILEADSEAALELARANFERLRSLPLTRETGRVLFIYEIVDPKRPGVRQIGLGGMTPTADIRTAQTPGGPIIRNEGVRAHKARGRARLIEATGAIIGTVNNAVPDVEGRLAGALEGHAAEHEADYETEGAGKTVHRIWLVREPGAVARLQHFLSEEPEAYVADGNHRSAAAAMLGHDTFLAVFFPADRMGIAPYNRLVRADGAAADSLVEIALSRSFDRLPETTQGPLQPRHTHELGLSTVARGWLRLSPRPGSFDPDDAAAAIDHDIVQRNLFAPLGIEDAGDERLTFVGANKDAAWLQAAVDAGRARLAVTLPPVTMDQFIAVCRQRRQMPPKSTWFEPKIRSGLVMALLGED